MRCVRSRRRLSSGEDLFVRIFSCEVTGLEPCFFCLAGQPIFLGRGIVEVYGAIVWREPVTDWESWNTFKLDVTFVKNQRENTTGKLIEGLSWPRVAAAMIHVVVSSLKPCVSPWRTLCFLYALYVGCGQLLYWKITSQSYFIISFIDEIANAKSFPWLGYIGSIWGKENDEMVGSSE